MTMLYKLDSNKNLSYRLWIYSQYPSGHNHVQSTNYYTELDFDLLLILCFDLVYIKINSVAI